MRLKDRVAVVTGGGVGIGQAFCRGLAAEGGRQFDPLINHIRGSTGDGILYTLNEWMPQPGIVRRIIGTCLNS